MIKITTLTTGIGMLTGLMTVGVLFFGLTPLHQSWAMLTLALAGVLAVDSVIAYVGPKSIFYSSAVISALLVGSESIGSGSSATAGTILAIGMAGVTMVLSVLAARFVPEVSEQSNPMNLPVFG